MTSSNKPPAYRKLPSYKSSIAAFQTKRLSSLLRKITQGIISHMKLSSLCNFTLENIIEIDFCKTYTISFPKSQIIEAMETQSTFSYLWQIHVQSEYNACPVVYILVHMIKQLRFHSQHNFLIPISLKTSTHSFIMIPMLTVWNMHLHVFTMLLMI